MDIQNNKTILQAKIKRFTLKATASAILTLNAETAIATATCPTYITADSGLAGLVCDFDINTLPDNENVTVLNGGTVGSIHMGGYTPTNSSITIVAGGQVSNTTGAGIAVTNNSSLTNGISNSGTISISIATSNAGISIATTSIISGGISNSGTISSTLGTGISIATASTINGGISNSGSINTGRFGINIVNSIINPDGNNVAILNTETISSTSRTAINILTSTITGNISNSGQIIGGNNDEGINISTSHITGDIVNSGSIHSELGNGILIASTSTLTGNILNYGSISAGGVGSAGSVGIELKLCEITEDIFNFNTGSIVSTKTAISIGVGGQAIIDGGISNSGTISGDVIGINFDNASIIRHDIINTGTIRGGTTAINLVGTSTVAGSISNSGIIQGDINIIGSVTGGLNISGQQARIIGNVNAGSTDMNITTGASFTSEGNYTVNNFNIANNALFNMTDTVTVTTKFNNSGTLAIGNALRTIAGDYTQNAGGVFQTGVTNTTTYGQLSVVSNGGAGPGIADLTQSGNIDVQVAQNASFKPGDILTDVINGVTFIPPTSGFDVTDNSAIWQFIAELNNAGTGVNLTLAVDPSAFTVCQGLYCQGAADTIIEQVISGNSLFGPYGALSASALQTAASQATPELTNENIQIIQLITRAVVDIAPMWNSLRGRSSGDAMLYQPGKIWVKPYGASMTQNERTTVNGFNAAAYGAVVGKDIELSNNWMLGGAFAAGGDNIQGKSVLSGQSIHSAAYQGMVYGSKKLPKQFYVAGQGLVGYENNNTSRAIPLYASTAKGSYNSWFTNIRAEAGWSTYAFGSNLLFTPEVDASYLFINQGSYQESGSPMDLSVAANNNSSLVLGAYGNGAYHLASLNNQQDLTLTAYAGVAGDVINSQPQVTSTFVAAGASFSTFGVQFNGAVFRGGAGLMITSPTKPLIVELNYDLQVGNNAYSGVGAATIKYKV